MNGSVGGQVEALWTKFEVASYLGKSPSWVSHNRHLLPEPCRIGGELRWVPAELRAWAHNQREARAVSLAPSR